MKKTFTLFLFSCLFFVVQATESHTVNTTAGNLATDASAYLTSVTNLTVTGTIDARDFKTMRDDMLQLATLNLSGATIAEYTGEATNGSKTYPANEIPEYSFYELSTYIAKTTLTSISMPSSVTSIGEAAFLNCSGLTGSLTIPSSVTSIGEVAFQNCSGLTGCLTIPSLVTNIGIQSFMNCTGLGSLSIPSSVTSIPINAFANCSHISYIKAYGDTPSSLEMNVFYNIPSTCKLYVPIRAKDAYADVYQWNAFTQIIEGFPSAPALTTNAATSITSAGATLNGTVNANNASTSVTFQYGLTTSYGTIVTADQSPVTGASATAVSYALTGLTPNTTYHYRVIGVNSEGTTNGGDMSFKTLGIPVISVSGVTAGGLSAAIAAAGGDLATVTDLTVTGTIDARDFKILRDNMPLLATLDLSGATIVAGTNIDGTNGTRNYPANEIPQYAFCTTGGIGKISLTSISMPSSVTSIGDYAFQSCTGLTGSLTIPSSVTTIGDFAFQSCTGFTGALTIPSSVTSIGTYAFGFCSHLTGSLTIPSSVTAIGIGVFQNCRGLTGSLTIPSSVTSIGAYAFYNCSNISSIKAYRTVPGSISLEFDVFLEIPTTTPLHVPAGTKALYEGANQWKAFTTIIDDLAIAPAATSTAASSITSGGAILNGTVNANNASTAVTFQYGLTTSYGNTVTASPSPVTGKVATAVSYTLSGLTPNTTYHYRVVGVNSEGTTDGSDMTFTTTDIAPNISYATPQSYVVGTAIAVLTPTNIGGAVPALTSPQVSTLAGSGAEGSADGLGTAASFNDPAFLVSDAVGNIYVSDNGNNLIRKITPSGDVSTLADAAAGIYSPIGIAVDAIGNVYVVDGDNSRILKVTSAGVVTTLAGSDSGEIGNTNGSGTAARFKDPYGLALDAAGNLYVADDGNKQIRKITPAGEVSTFAGSGARGSADGNGTSASFGYPEGIAIDAAGNLYVTEEERSSVRKITPAGDVTTLAGAIASSSELSGIAVDASANLYVTDIVNNLIGKISPAGDVTILAGSGSRGANNGAGETASFRTPMGITVDASGNLYVADTYNNLIRKITQSAYTISPALPAGLSLDGATGTITGTPTAASAATTYTISAANSGGSSAATISIAVKSPQTITFDALPTKTYGDAAFNLAATSTSGLVISYSSDNTAVATVSGSTVTIVGAGTANITASQAGNTTYAAAANVIQQLMINKKALSVTAITDTKIYDGTTVSTAIPTVGTLATDDAINVAPAQVFDNANVGTTHVLTASGLTIKRVVRDNAPALDKTKYKIRIPNEDVTSNYDISYITATGTINKKAVTVTAVADTKTYDGTTVSTAIPTVGTLATDDAINVAPAQAFDNAAVGTTHGLTASGLTIKNGTTDVTGNYDISYATATGTINKLGVTVTAVVDTKTYDGTTVSTAIPTVGTLAAGDAINVAPAQVFDNATVGTTHVLTASGLTIKNGSADVTGNYDISYTTATGTINKLGVTVTAIADTKTYNGTTVSTAIPTVGTLAAGDAINVAPAQVFDNASVGTTHVLTASGLTIKNGSADVTGNYDISYTTATGTINKLGVTLTAVADTKTYDGTTVSTAIPMVGTLATGDAINTAPTQVFDNASVGTTHVLTASGLTIKNGSADVTGNYDISYATATGTINKLGVTVTAVSDTKTYDGTIVSTAIPTVGTLATGDAINVAPMQVFDIAAVGTTHVLTASGLTIKNGSADVTGNYDISYASATGSITAKALTITTPAVTLSKVYDGNTVAAVTAGTLSGVVAGDAGKVTVAAVASYDNATIGTNKTITVTYTLGGSSAGNYSAPANYIATGAEIYSATIALQPLSNPTSNPANSGLVLSYSVVTGGPTQYQITFETRAVAVGIQNVSYTALATTGTDGSISITVPKGTRPGKYKGTLKMRNDSGVESTAYDFVITVNIPTEYIAVKYNRVLVLDNSTKIFKAYQWFKNGVAIEGATKQFYRDPKGLVGTYSMQATDIDGETIYSFPKELNIPITQKVTAYPSLVGANRTCTVEITDEAMELDLKGAELSVYSSQGIRVYHSTNVEKLNTIKLPAMDGTYSGRVTTTDGQSFLFKVIVAN